jgi:hypothetical protein
LPAVECASQSSCMRRSVSTIVFDLRENVGLKDIEELAILQVLWLVLCVLAMFEII